MQTTMHFTEVFRQQKENLIKKEISESEQNSLTVKTWISENRLKMTKFILFGIKNEYGKM